MKKLKLVIFDMDGLMFDTEKMGSQTLRQAAEEFGYTISDELILSLIGGNMERNTQLLKEALGKDCPLDDIRERSAKYREDYFKEHGLVLKPGLKELITYLKQKQIKIAIASSSSRVAIDRYLVIAELVDQFDYIISGDKVTHSKPDPEIFLNACDYFKVLPQEALVLEDSKNGVLAAHRGHIPVICVPDLIFHCRDIFSLTKATVPSLLKVMDIIEGKKPKLAIFDMDGLMFDTEQMCIEPIIQAHLNHGYPMTKEICYKMIGASGKITREILENEFGQDYPFDKLDQYSYQLLFERIEKEGLPIKSGLIELLEHLKQLEIPCVIASSSSTKVIEHYLKISNTSQYFVDIVGGDKVKASKPEPDIFNKACEIFKVNPQEAIVLEDSKNGIIAANRAGIPVICVPDILMHDQSILGDTEMFVPSLDKLIEMIK